VRRGVLLRYKRDTFVAIGAEGADITVFFASRAIHFFKVSQSYTISSSFYQLTCNFCMFLPSPELNRLFENFLVFEYCFRH